MAGLVGFLARDGAGVPERAALLARLAGALTSRGTPHTHDDGRLALASVGPGGDWTEEPGAGLVVALDGFAWDQDEPLDAAGLARLYAHGGSRALARLRGEYVVALWDAARARLVLARDPLGARPLMHARVAGGVLFASELKALRAHPDCPRALDWSILDASPDVRSSGVSGASHLPAGQVVELGADGLAHVCSTWRLTAAPDARPAAAAEALRLGVRERVRGEACVGVVLDGAASWLLAACAAAEGAEVRACLPADLGLTADAGEAEMTPESALALLEAFVALFDSPLVEPADLLRHELSRRARAACPDVRVWLSSAGAELCAAAPPARSRARRIERLRVPERLIGFLADAFPPPGDPDEAGDFGEALRPLRDEGLRGFARGAALDGGEVRHPWLDARLLALAAGAALDGGAWWRALNAALLAEFPAAAVRPPAPEDLPWAVAGERLRRDLVSAAYPAFRRGYLAAPDALLSADALALAFRTACGPGRGEPRLLSRLYQGMTLSIFERQGRAPWRPTSGAPPRVPLAALAFPVPASPAG